MRREITVLAFSALLAMSSAVMTGQQNPSPAPLQRDGANAVYKININVTERTMMAINYRNRSGSTRIDFKGTPLLPKAKGDAWVESANGHTEIKAELEDLEPATRFGPEYLTYVLWAVSPEGRARNLGEVLLDDGKNKVEVTTELQAFGLFITAEPYFAVNQPSDLVVMENYIRADTRGLVDQINAKFELLPRGVYSANVLPADLKPIPLEKKVPLDLYEARNAVRIARWSGADTHAADTYVKAEGLLQQAENYLAQKEWKHLSTVARQAVQTAEDSRLITLKRVDEDRAAREQAATSAREADARAKTEQAKADAERSELLREQEALKRAAAESDKAAAEANAARQSTEAQHQTERAANDRLAAEADAERARQSAVKSETEKQELRQRLVVQLNELLQTRDSARGLIVNMSDVLFDTGESTLKPGAREKLAKISGIVVAHPGLKLEVEGHTDNVGTDEYNQTLSEQRASAVRTYLLQQGVRDSDVTARGFGKSRPITSNDTPSGRQLNRRVELVVSGDIIGNPGSNSVLP